MNCELKFLFIFETYLDKTQESNDVWITEGNITVRGHASRGRLRAGEHFPELGDEPLALISRSEARAAAEPGVAILEEAEQ